MSSGFVSIVGAGPGDPGLLTLAGRDRLALADVVIYDGLVHPALLDLVAPGAVLVDAGEAKRSRGLEQSNINDLLVRFAKKGRRVVRLKGGDPFVFGRGAEEAEALAGEGIAFEIVPGVSSAVAVPAFAGIPLTDRRIGSSVAVVSGHVDPGDSASRVRWDLLASGVDTIVVLMGMRNLGAIVEALIAHGRDGATPAAVVQSGTYEGQRTIVTPLSQIADAVAEAKLGPPAVVIVGDVVNFRERIAWFDESSDNLAHLRDELPADPRSATQ